MGQSPQLLPPILHVLPTGLAGMKEAIDAMSIIEQVTLNVQEVKDLLAAAKITQVHYTKLHHRPEDAYVVGDLVMLSTDNQYQKYKKKGEFLSG